MSSAEPHLCMACGRLRPDHGVCPGCGGQDVVGLGGLLAELTRRYQKVDRWGWTVAVPLLYGFAIAVPWFISGLAGMIGIATLGGTAIFLGVRGVLDPNRRLYRALAARPAALLLPEGRRAFTGRAGGAGRTLQAPLSGRPAVLIRHDVMVGRARVAHCTSGGDLTVAGAEHMVRVLGPVDLTSAPLSGRSEARAGARLLIDGQPVPLAALHAAFGKRARIEERLIAEGDPVTVSAPAELVELVGEAGGDAYRSAGAVVINAQPGRPARLARARRRSSTRRGAPAGPRAGRPAARRRRAG